MLLSAIGIDIGGGRTRAGVIDATGRLLALRAAPTPPGGAPTQLAECIRSLVQEVIGEARRAAITPPSDVARFGMAPPIGIVLPGLWDRQTGIMQRAVNLPQLEGANLPELFAAALGRPVFVETDAIAAGWAQWLAVARTSGTCSGVISAPAGMSPISASPDRASVSAPPRFVYLSIGTGVGGCVILDGQIIRHTRGSAGALGHLIVDTLPDAPLCRCGARGCLEALVGGWALDANATASLDGAAAALATGLLPICHIYAPDTIALGGGVIEHRPELLDRTIAEFATRRSTLVPADLKILRAPLATDQAGVIGAALLALEM